MGAGGGLVSTEGEARAACRYLQLRLIKDSLYLCFSLRAAHYEPKEVCALFALSVIAFCRGEAQFVLEAVSGDGAQKGVVEVHERLVERAITAMRYGLFKGHCGNTCGLSASGAKTSAARAATAAATPAATGNMGLDVFVRGWLQGGA